MKQIHDVDRTYRILLPVVNWMFRHSYRHIKYVGKENIPTDGAVIFAPNHTNALQDALAVLSIDSERKVFVARADIFRNNALNNGLLPVTVSEQMLEAIFAAVNANPKAELKIDLPTQTIEIVGTEHKESFEIAPYKKQCLVNGYDDVDFLVSIRADIEAFEQK